MVPMFAFVLAAASRCVSLFHSVNAPSHPCNMTPTLSAASLPYAGTHVTGDFSMKHADTNAFVRPLFLQSGLAVAVLLSGLASIPVALADDDDADLRPGNLLLSRVVYDNNPNNVVAGVTVLPPNCVGAACAKATAGGTYPTVFNNASVDGSFGITSKIVLDQLTPFGERVSSLEVPNSSQRGITSNADQMVGSFSSKSELALNLSADKTS